MLAASTKYKTYGYGLSEPKPTIEPRQHSQLSNLTHIRFPGRGTSDRSHHSRRWSHNIRPGRGRRWFGESITRHSPRRRRWRFHERIAASIRRRGTEAWRIHHHRRTHHSSSTASTSSARMRRSGLSRVGIGRWRHRAIRTNHSARRRDWKSHGRRSGRRCRCRAGYNWRRGCRGNARLGIVRGTRHLQSGMSKRRMEIWRDC